MHVYCHFPQQIGHFPLGIKCFPPTAVYIPYQLHSNRAIKSNLLWKKVKVNKYLHFCLSLAEIATDIQLGNKREVCQMFPANRWSRSYLRTSSLPGNQTFLLQQLWFESIYVSMQTSVNSEWRLPSHSHHWVTGGRTRWRALARTTYPQ